MLTISQYQILNSCCNDAEIFYFLFAEVNYGGQLFYRSEGRDYAQYVEDHEWSIKVSSEIIVRDLIELINVKFLEYRKLAQQREDKCKLDSFLDREFAVYANYTCQTFEEHLDRYGYGPHEFQVTELGLKEMDKPVYHVYDEQLGYQE